MAGSNKTDDQLIVKGTIKSRDVPISGPKKKITISNIFFFVLGYHLSSFIFKPQKTNPRRTFNSSILKHYNVLYWKQILINIFFKIPIRLDGNWGFQKEVTKGDLLITVSIDQILPLQISYFEKWTVTVENNSYIQLSQMDKFTS